MTQTTRTLPERLRIMAGMLAMGERISFGSDSVIMDEAAKEIENLQSQIQALVSQNALKY